MAKLRELEAVNSDINKLVYKLDDFNLNIIDHVLEPVLSEPVTIPTLSI